MTPIAFVDVETLNLRRPLFGEEPGVWEAAAIRCDLDPDARTLTIVGNWWGFIEVPDNAMLSADPGSLRVNRFYERHPAFRPGPGIVLDHPTPGVAVYPRAIPDGPEHEQSWDIGPDDLVWNRVEASRQLARIMNGGHLVAANPSFDEERLAIMLHEDGQCLAVDYHLGCVRQLAAGWLAGRASVAGHPVSTVALPPLSGSKLMEAVGVELDDGSAHSAWADTVAAMVTYARIFALTIVDPATADAEGDGPADDNGQALADEVWMMPDTPQEDV